MDRWTAIRQAAARALEKFEIGSKQAAFTAERGCSNLLHEIAQHCEQLGIVEDPDLQEGTLGELDLDSGTITVRPGLNATRRAWLIAHELGHACLKHPPRQILEEAEHVDEEPHVGALVVRDGIYRTYSSRDHWELEANVFAAELLAPVARVRARVKEDSSWTVDGLAAYFGISRSAMSNQLAAALLPGPPMEQERSAAAPPALIGKQQDAATTPPPALVVAGPGAGKTRVLVSRFAHLVEQGTEPRRILALTFGNKAAEEMRDRLTALLPNSAHEIVVTTFHALGLELLQAYGGYLDLKQPPQLLTELDAFVLLRSRLSQLPLGYFEDLHRPTRHLRDLLSAISRAKDELVDPNALKEMVLEWQASLQRTDDGMDNPATCPSGSEEVERALDTAAIYATYQSWLREGGYLDYGDLIAEAVRLFSILEVADAIRSQYDHILVDEFQDINYASGRFVLALDGGRGIVWAVGDPRQSIYRFRGATPFNLANFTVDYPGARVILLEVNYRSVEDVVKAGLAVPIPSLTENFTLAPALRSHRGRLSAQPAVELLIAATGDDELSTLVERVRTLSQDMPLSDIAVLCRTRDRAQDVSQALEQAHIQSSWAGALEERGAFKDLMAMLLLAADDPAGLVRIAGIPEHHLEEADLHLLLQVAHKRGNSAQAALHVASDGEVEGLSEEGQQQASALRRLTGALSHHLNPWHALSHYLFEEARWIRELLADPSHASYRRILTVGQVATLARDFSQRTTLAGGTNIQAFVDFLYACLEAGELGAGAPIASDGVQVLTVHGSKGLEWPVVFVPHLADGRFPLKDQHPPLPVPPILLRGHLPAGMSEEPEFVEEACLFYVAVTRARDHLILSRAEKYGTRSPAPSPFLDAMATELTASGYLQQTCAPSSFCTSPPRRSALSSPARDDVAGKVLFRGLQTYENCPQKFQYAHLFGLHDSDSGYLIFHRTTYATMQWAAEQAVAGTVPSPYEVAREMDVRWDEIVGADKPSLEQYRSPARRAAQAFAARLSVGIPVRLRQEKTIRAEGRTISITVDEIEDGPEEVWRRHHFGRPAESHKKDDHLPALYAAAYAQQHGSKPQRIYLHYLLHGGDVEIQPTAKVISNRTKKMADLAAAIEHGRFAPKPGDHQCSICRYNLICPMKGLE